MTRPWLALLTPLYTAGVALRNLRLRTGLEPIRRLRSPVISIGNLSTGGSGKTPLTIALAKALTRRGFQVDVLSRGYGRQSRLPASVDPDGTVEEFGDEPLLIAREAGVPVYVAAQRYQAGLLAESAEASLVGRGFSPGAMAAEPTRALAPEGTLPGDSEFINSLTFHILDDGFQHRQLHRDVDILLLNAEDWADSLLPAGNLREPLKALRRATIIAIPADQPTLEADLRNYGYQGPLWTLHRKMEVPAVTGPVAAFCGIARPEQFFQGIESQGIKIAARSAFPDHHCYTTADLARLTTAAQQAGATALLTTEKDAVRLGKLGARLPSSLPLKTVRLHVEIESEDQAIEWLTTRLALSHPRSSL
jgi:tetraacyldisaccharide 4'-kinase